MDLQTGLICIGLIIVSGVVLLLISIFSIKEKTYEEARAEQKKRPIDSLLVKRQPKPKPKEKKSKPNKKKKKELEVKLSSTDTEEAEPEHTEPVHVTILPEAEILGEDVKPEPQGKKKKQKVKPILVNREVVPAAGDSTAEPEEVVNHFEDTKPKDVVSLRRTSVSQFLSSVNRFNVQGLSSEAGHKKTK